MFSVIFPGQGSQMVGMGKEFYDKFDLVKNLFKEADDTLNFSISKLILEGPKEELDLTANTQPAIFLISYSIYSVIRNRSILVHSPSCTPRARMSSRRARPLPSRQSFFSPRLRDTVVPLREPRHLVGL